MNLILIEEIPEPFYLFSIYLCHKIMNLSFILNRNSIRITEAVLGNSRSSQPAGWAEADLAYK